MLVRANKFAKWKTGLMRHDAILLALSILLVLHAIQWVKFTMRHMKMSVRDQGAAQQGNVLRKRPDKRDGVTHCLRMAAEGGEG